MAEDRISGELRRFKKQRTRDAVLDATAELLSNKFIADVSVDEIARRAGVSRATVFNYFPTKRDLVLGIADREIASLAVYARAAVARGDEPLAVVEELMYRLARVSFDAGPAGWQIVRTLLEDPLHSPSPVWVFLDLLDELLTRAVRRNEVRSDVATSECARIVFGAFVAEMFAAAGGAREPRLERKDFDRIANTLLTGFAASRGGGR